MFERFTETARQVVIKSQEVSRSYKHSYIGTEHLLVGLLQADGLAARVLESLDVTEEIVRAQIDRRIGNGEAEVSGQIPFTPRAKKVLELSLREALSLGHNYIGTEHILLGLVRENEGVAAAIFLDLELDSEKIRNEVIRMLSGPAARSAARRQQYDWSQITDVDRLKMMQATKCQAKENAIEAHQFVRASEIREEERLIAARIRELESEEAADAHEYDLEGGVQFDLVLRAIALGDSHFVFQPTDNDPFEFGDLLEVCIRRVQR